MAKRKDPLFYLTPEDEEHMLAEKMAEILAQEKELREEYAIYQERLTKLLLAKGIKRAKGTGFSLLVWEVYAGYDWDRITKDLPTFYKKYHRKNLPMEKPKAVVYPKKKKYCRGWDTCDTPF